VFHVKHLDQLDLDVIWQPFTQQAEWAPLVIARRDGDYLATFKI
jgi:hypothetical protein